MDDASSPAAASRFRRPFNDPDTRIRTATLVDLEIVAPLFDAYRQFYERPSDPDLARAFLHERIRRDESVVLLAENGSGQGVGFCQLYPSFCSLEVAPIYALYDLFVAPSHRRSGAGRSLLLAAEAEVRRRGASRMDLTTARSNLAAQSLYESLGWIRDEVFLGYSRRIGMER